MGPIPQREAVCDDLDAMVIKARDRHIEVTDKGVRGHVRGHSSPGLAAHAGCCTLERAASTPDREHAARRSPRGSRGRRHRWAGGGGRRRKGSEGKAQVGTVVKGQLLNGPVWENRRACKGS